MKRFVSLILTLCMLTAGLTGVAEEKKGLLDSIGDGLNDAWKWTQGATDDVAGWTSQAASDMADWTTNAANDVADWISQAAGDVADWTTNAANDAWTATSNAWYEVSKTVKGVWNNETGEFEAEETENAEEEPELDPNALKFYMGALVNTGTDNGFSKDGEIKLNDPHFGWSLGNFYVSGFTRVMEDEQGNPVFMKTVGDTVALHFELYQDIDKLNGNVKITISGDENGYDERFGIPKTDFGRGTLIIRHKDYTNLAGEPTIYTDFLSARAAGHADTTVDLFEEGDYEVALDYEIKDASGLIAKYSNYRIAFKFSVRNGNCMVYPFDLATGAELTNGAITENGFRLDLARSRYLDINVKKETASENGDDTVDDTRFNRPAKDGDAYTDAGIYTITAYNRYTQQETEKIIYVGSN